MMANVEPLRVEDAPELASLIGQISGAMGFVQNSLLTMARRPEIARAFIQLAGAVLGPGELGPDFKQLVAYVASTAAGCRYCQAHTAGGAARMGLVADKIEAAWEFETDSRVDAAERAALRQARDAALIPNATTPQHFSDLRRYFSKSQIVELVAVISIFGYLNRWNDTMATQLEAEPLEFASRHLAKRVGSRGSTRGLRAASSNSGGEPLRSRTRTSRLRSHADNSQVRQNPGERLCGDSGLRVCDARRGRKSSKRDAADWWRLY